MEESLRGGGSYYLSRKDIEKMRKNMKKVPVIQEKSETYHKHQDEEAELFIDKSLDGVVLGDSNVLTDENRNESLDGTGLRNRLVGKIKNLLSKKSNGN